MPPRKKGGSAGGGRAAAAAVGAEAAVAAAAVAATAEAVVAGIATMTTAAAVVVAVLAAAAAAAPATTTTTVAAAATTKIKRIPTQFSITDGLQPLKIRCHEQQNKVFLRRFGQFYCFNVASTRSLKCFCLSCCFFVSTLAIFFFIEYRLILTCEIRVQHTFTSLTCEKATYTANF